MANELSEYEQKRLQQIEENKKLLNQLNLPGTLNELSSSRSKSSNKSNQQKSKASKSSSTKENASTRSSRKRSETPIVRRESKRLKKLDVDSEEAERIRKEEEEEAAKLEEQARAEKHADRKLRVLSRTGNPLSDDSSKAANESLRTTLASVSRSQTPQGTRDVEDTKDQNVKDLHEAFSQMQLKCLTKFIPDRVYTLAVHPDIQKDLIFAGDKSGHLGIIDATAEARRVDDQTGDDNGEGTVKEEEKEDEETKSTWTIKGHSKGTISQVEFDPTDPHTLYTSSYDCTLRSFNFETGTSTEILDMDVIAQDYEYAGEALLSSISITPDGKNMWISDTKGGLLHKDLRTNKSESQRWRIAPNKVGCVSVNPIDNNILVTAHLNRDLSVWDVRKLYSNNLNQDTAPSDIIENARIGSFQHGFACSSAYWDPSGSHVVTTSYDDCCRVWNINPSDRTFNKKLNDGLKPDVIVKHNNQTGRYVSVLKAKWTPYTAAAQHFTIGNMNHSLDVIAYDGTQIASLYDPEYVTAVPAATASHPSILQRAYGATASGKISVWAP